MYCELLVKNANIITLSSAKEKASWMAVKDGRILAIGGEEPYSGESLKILDLAGKTVTPGFIDTHVHGTLTGEALNSADLNGMTSSSQILDAIEKIYSNNPDRSIITATGFSEIDLLDGKVPSAEQLDEISKDQIILIYDKSYHGCILNSKGLELGNLHKGMPGVEIENDRMTGKVSDDTSYYFAVHNIMKLMGQDIIKEYMRATEQLAVSQGITSIHSLDGGDYGVDMPAWIENRGILNLHVVNYWETMDFEKVMPYKLPRIGGCICLDGSRVLRTMALMEPYTDLPAARGPLYYKDEDIYNFVKTAHKNNMQCSMHATGDRSIDQYIYILKQVIEEQGDKGLRHRIEHFAMPTDRHIEMAVEIGLALAMQPFFPKVWDQGEDSLYKQRFGKERAGRVEPIGKILRAGGMVCGGSDSPVTRMNPLAGIDACVNTNNEDRRVTPQEALKIFTFNGAWAAHEEHERGSLEKGKLADFTVLSGNPLLNFEKINNINVENTYINGQLVFERTV